MHWNEQGREPDYRFSLANERTFLAWIRTALALLAGGLLLFQFVTRLQPHGLLLALSTGLAAMAAVLAALAFFRWRAIQLAMRLDQPLPASRLVALLALGVTLLAGAAALLLVAQ